MNQRPFQHAFRSTIALAVIALAQALLPTSAPAGDLADYVPNWSSAVVYYVRTTGNDTADGLSPATAFQTLAKAMTVAGPNRTIIVGAGSYQHTTYLSPATSAGSFATPCVFYADKTGQYTGDPGDVNLLTPLSSSTWTIYLWQRSGFVFSGFNFREAPNITYYPKYPYESSSTWSATYRIPYGFYAYGSDSVALHNCSFIGMHHAVHFHTCTNSVVNSCSFRDTRYMHVYPHYCQGLEVSDCTFANGNSYNWAYNNYVYNVYAHNSRISVLRSTFDESVAYAVPETVSGAYNKGAHVYTRGIQVDSFGSDPNRSEPNLGDLTVSSCTFTKFNELTVYSAWNKAITASGNILTDCRYGIHAHAEVVSVTANTLTQTASSLWKATWSWGVYLNAFAVPTNKMSGQGVKTTPGLTSAATCSNNTFTNWCYAVLVGSDNVSLSNLTLTGDTRWTDANRSAWVNYSHGIYCGWNCKTFSLDGSANVNMTNMWVAITVSGPDQLNLSNLTLADHYYGINGNNGAYNLSNVNLLRNDTHGAAIWWAKSLTMNNCVIQDTKRSWGMYCYGQKIPRTPQGSTTNWNWYQEMQLNGTYSDSFATVNNCQFKNNAYGVFFAYMNNTLTGSGNVVSGNSGYALGLHDGVWEITNDNFLVQNNPNAYGITSWGYGGVDYKIAGKTTVTNCNLSGNLYGVVNWDTEFKAVNSKFFNNTNTGLHCWRGKCTVNNVECYGNNYGVDIGGALAISVDGANCRDNRTVGLQAYVFNTWYSRPETPTYDVQNVTCTKNVYGMIAYAFNIDANGAWLPGTNFTFPIRTSTFNQNSYIGLLTHYGWLKPDNNLQLVANDNGSYATNGAGNWGFGFYFYDPQRMITLTSALGINASNNSWGGFAINPRNIAPVDVNLAGVTLGKNKYTSVFCGECRNIKVTNSDTGGVWLNQPQGDVTVDNSNFSGSASHGFVVNWGWYADPSWVTWLQQIGVTMGPPKSISFNNSTFNNNGSAGVYTGWWQDWDKPNLDKRPTTPVTYTNCTANNNYYRGFENWNNNVTATGTNATGNGLSAILVWNGNCTLRNCAFNNNVYGRFPDANGQLTAKWGWVAAELVHYYNDGRKWTYDVKDVTVNNNEGHGIYCYNFGGTVKYENVTANGNYYYGILVGQATSWIRNCTAGLNRYIGFYQQSGSVDIADCQANGNGTSNEWGWGFYLHGSYTGVQNADGSTTYYAANNETIAANNLTANDNRSGGILGWCYTGSITNSTANRSQSHGFQIGYSDQAKAYGILASNCSATGNGWCGMYAYDTRATLQNCNLSGNGHGSFHQNAPSGSGSRVVATDCNFSGNKYWGTVLYNTAVDLQRVQMNGMTEGSGGWIGWTTNGAVNVQNCQFQNNRDHGLWLDSAQAANVERNLFVNNGQWGLVMYRNQANTAMNNIVARNMYGSYFWDLGGGTRVFNNTIADGRGAYGVYAQSGLAEIRNNLIANNTAWGLCVNQAVPTTSNNLVFGHQTNTDYWSASSSVTAKAASDVNKPPRFVNNAAGDYHLAKGSPAINAGFTMPQTLTADFEGNARPMYRAFEIGAYEYANPSGSVRVTDWNEAR